MSTNESRPDAHGAALAVTADESLLCLDGTKVSGQLDRRRATACRVPALRCGCADPWTCRCGAEPALTEHYLDGWRDSAHHLLGCGLAPIVPIPVLRALWRRGGRDQDLAEYLTRRERARR
ncbi:MULTISPECIES: hypothetical protein [Rhodococcus]|uniref:hypothetical protein n=1 Tax=Rhodococcus TaxID=1827 RepID=UPI001EF0FA0A|nr:MULTISPECIES: hypothetical protein [Rhodococcus]